MKNSGLVFILTGFAWKTALAVSPRIECDGAMLAVARNRIEPRQEPLFFYWLATCFSIGFEGLGRRETEEELVGLSLAGTQRRSGS